MSGKKWIPGPSDVVRETLIVVAGAMLAAVIFQIMPGLKTWVADRLPKP